MAKSNSNRKSAKRRRKYNTSKNIARALATVGLGYEGAKVYTKLATKSDGTEENTKGYDNYNLRFNKKVSDNNFVVLHVQRKDIMDVKKLTDKLDKLYKEGVSVSLVLDTNASNLAEINSDIDYLIAILKEYTIVNSESERVIDLPVYCNIDNILLNKELNNAQREVIINCFIDRMNNSNIYLGLYGTDTNLKDCYEHVISQKYSVGEDKLTNIVVMEKEEIDFKGNKTIIRNLDGTYTASFDLSKSIKESGLNNSELMSYPAIYKVKEGDTVHSIALENDLSDTDLLKYNDIREISVGQKIKLPNKYENVNVVKNKTENALAKGIDISYCQSNTDWNIISKNVDFVIIRVTDLSMKNNDIDVLFASHFENATSHSLPVGMYFLIERTVPNDYLDRIKEHLITIDNLIAKTELKKEDIPVFIDIEEYSNKYNYASIMENSTKLFKEYDYETVGIYANSNVLRSIKKNLEKNNSSLDNWIVWQAGGNQYIDEFKSNDTIDYNSVKEYRDQEFSPIVQQATNAGSNVGASNNANRCDVDFLYEKNIFGSQLVIDDEKVETNEYSSISLDDYNNIPIESISNMGINVLTSVLTILIMGQTIIKAIDKKFIDKNERRKTRNGV